MWENLFSSSFQVNLVLKWDIPIPQFLYENFSPSLALSYTFTKKLWRVLQIFATVSDGFWVLFWNPTKIGFSVASSSYGFSLIRLSSGSFILGTSLWSSVLFFGIPIHTSLFVPVGLFHSFCNEEATPYHCICFYWRFQQLIAVKRF